MRECLEKGVERICVFSRGEHCQAEMRQSLGNPEAVRWFIGDVRDRDRLRRAMGRCDTVVHAAALKRVEVGHYNPIEMVRTNVGGAMNVIEAAMDAAIGRVVALSTDKAYQPVSAYGASKALAESLFLAANGTTGQGGPVFVVTRYGNVAGSAGSVIPKWRSLLADGVSTVPVTDPECTRFWMTMREAVDMVWEAASSRNASIARPIVPSLRAYRLGDLAAAMGAEMEVIGLPEWEKRHECMAYGNCSNRARRMTVDELKEALAHV